MVPFVPASFGNANGPVISLTSDGGGLGDFVQGGSLANFNGSWTATYTFYVPANAINPVLEFTNFFADDRAVLKLNGTIISSTGAVPPGGSLDGFMVLTDGGPAGPVHVCRPLRQRSGKATSGFVTGTNTLTVVLNNTGTGVAGTMNGNLAWNDGTGMGLSGTVSYVVRTGTFDTANPEQWLVSAGHAQNGQNVIPWKVNGTILSVTSDSSAFGTSLPGGQVSEFLRLLDSSLHVFSSTRAHKVLSSTLMVSTQMIEPSSCSMEIPSAHMA